MEYYENERLDKIAIETLDDINDLGTILQAIIYGMPGIEGTVNVLNQINETPYNFIISVFNKNIGKINQIKFEVGENDAYFMQLSDALAITIVAIYNVYVRHAQLCMGTSDFSNNKRDSSIQKIRENLRCLREFLIELKGMKVGYEVRNNIETTEDTLSKIEKLYTPKTFLGFNI